MTTTPDLDGLRRLVGDHVHDDLSDAAPEDDLRDYGLDSLRLVAVVERLRAEGHPVRFEDVAATPTLAALTAAVRAA